MNRHLLWLAAAMVVAGCESSGEVDRQINERQAALTKLSQDLVSQAPWLSQPKDVMTEVRLRAFAQYLNEITTPAITLNIDGVSAGGDVLYKPGLGKAWIGPPNDIRGHVSISGFSLKGSDTGLNWEGQLAADVQSRLQLEVLRVRSNVLCDGRLDDMRATGVVIVSMGDNTTANYAVAITSPGSISINAGCGLGLLGRWGTDLNFGGAAQQFAKGTLPLVVSNQGKLEPPNVTPAKSLSYSVATRDPELLTRSDGVTYRANVDVTVAH